MTWDGIARVTDWHQPSYINRYIEGLNLFRANKVDLPVEQDPRLLFLREMLAFQPSPFLVSSPALDSDTISDYFDARDVRFAPTPIDLYAGQFFAGKGTIVSAVDTALFNKKMPFFQEMLSYDGFAFLLSPDNNAVFDFFSGIQPDGEISLLPHERREEQIENYCLAHCDLMLTSESDGWSINLFASEIATLNRYHPAVDRAIEVAVASIKANPWFGANHSRLVWDDADLDQCLKAKAESSDEKQGEAVS